MLAIAADTARLDAETARIALQQHQSQQPEQSVQFGVIQQFHNPIQSGGGALRSCRPFGNCGAAGCAAPVLRVSAAYRPEIPDRERSIRFRLIRVGAFLLWVRCGFVRFDFTEDRAWPTASARNPDSLAILSPQQQARFAIQISHPNQFAIGNTVTLKR
jgi:hypothetical protein